MEVCSNVIETDTASVQLNDDGIPKQVNDYRITGLLGQGTFAKVYQCQTSKGQEYALKVLNKSFLKRKREYKKVDGKLVLFDALQKVQKEVAILKKLWHKNLIKLYEIIDSPADDKMFLVLEFVEGGQVMHFDNKSFRYHSRRFPEGIMPKELVRNCIFDITNALDYLHTNHICHRDIKPENILMTKDEIFKLADLGVAHMLDGNAQRSLRNTEGTYHFLAPECTTGQEYDPFKVDIWALGVTMYVMMQGSLPFGNASHSLSEVTESIRHDDLRFPLEMDLDCVLLMRQMMEKDPSKRITIEQLKVHDWVTFSDRTITMPMETKANKVDVTAQEIEAAFTPVNNFIMLAKVKMKMGIRLANARRSIRSKNSVSGPLAQVQMEMAALANMANSLAVERGAPSGQPADPSTDAVAQNDVAKDSSASVESKSTILDASVITGGAMGLTASRRMSGIRPKHASSAQDAIAAAMITLPHAVEDHLEPTAPQTTSVVPRVLLKPRTAEIRGPKIGPDASLVETNEPGAQSSVVTSDSITVVQPSTAPSTSTPTSEHPKGPSLMELRRGRGEHANAGPVMQLARGDDIVELVAAGLPLASSLVLEPTKEDASDPVVASATALSSTTTMISPAPSASTTVVPFDANAHAAEPAPQSLITDGVADPRPTAVVCGNAPQELLKVAGPKPVQHNSSFSARRRVFDRTKSSSCDAVPVVLPEQRDRRHSMGNSGIDQEVLRELKQVAQSKQNVSPTARIAIAETHASILANQIAAVRVGQASIAGKERRRSLLRQRCLTEKLGTGSERRQLEGPPTEPEPVNAPPAIDAVIDLKQGIEANTHTNGGGLTSTHQFDSTNHVDAFPSVKVEQHTSEDQAMKPSKAGDSRRPYCSFDEKPEVIAAGKVNKILPRGSIGSGLQFALRKLHSNPSCADEVNDRGIDSNLAPLPGSNREETIEPATSHALGKHGEQRDLPAESKTTNSTPLGHPSSSSQQQLEECELPPGVQLVNRSTSEDDDQKPSSRWDAFVARATHNMLKRNSSVAPGFDSLPTASMHERQLNPELHATRDNSDKPHQLHRLERENSNGFVHKQSKPSEAETDTHKPVANAGSRLNSATLSQRDSQRNSANHSQGSSFPASPRPSLAMFRNRERSFLQLVGFKKRPMPSEPSGSSPKHSPMATSANKLKTRGRSKSKKLPPQAPRNSHLTSLSQITIKSITSRRKRLIEFLVSWLCRHLKCWKRNSNHVPSLVERAGRTPSSPNWDRASTCPPSPRNTVFRSSEC